MKLSEIIYKDEYILSEIDSNTEFTEITTSVEKVTEDSILLLPSSSKEYLRSGNALPIAIICDVNAHIPNNIPSIRVENIRKFIANAYYRFNHLSDSKMKIIGITGTNGKTSTATFIKSILRDAGYKVGFIGTGMIEIAGESIGGKQYSMTTPDPSLLYNIMKEMDQKGCEVLIMEVSSHALALHKVAPITFDYGIFTNLSSEHLDFHGNIDDYYLAKKSMFSQCRVGVFNLDDEYAKRAFEECRSRKLSTGVLWRGDTWVSSLQNNGLNGISYIFNQRHFSFKVDLRTAGTYNVYNSMMAAAVCIDMGCKPCLVKKSLENVVSIPGRFEIINDEITVIIDYAHTEAAFLNIMKNLHEIKKGNKLTVIFGCGGERDREKRPKMAEIAERFADKIVITTDNSRGENPKDIICDIIRGIKEKSVTVNENRKNAITECIVEATPGEIIAIIGKGCEKYTIDKDGYHDFDERAIINDALKLRK